MDIQSHLARDMGTRRSEELGLLMQLTEELPTARRVTSQLLDMETLQELTQPPHQPHLLLL